MKRRMGHKQAGFTLVELMVVMAITGILLALITVAASSAINQAKRSRTRGEISAFVTALEAYKTDNGVYPPSIVVYPTDGIATPYMAFPNPVVYNGAPGPANILYAQLSGHYNAAGAESAFNDVMPLNNTGKVYYQFTLQQLGNPLAATTYVKDPFNYPYGYSTGDVNPSTADGHAPLNGVGQFDLWSTGGKVGAAPAAEYASWLTNWGVGN